MSTEESLDQDLAAARCDPFVQLSLPMPDVKHAFAAFVLSDHMRHDILMHAVCN